MDYTLLQAAQTERAETRINHCKNRHSAYSNKKLTYICTSFLLKRRREDRENRYTNVMRSLVWRYVSSMHRRYEESAVTEDDINEVKADISSMRYEMLAIFEKNGMDISSAEKKERSHLAKRMKVWERRLMKDFQVAPITGDEEREEVQQPLDKGIARFRRVAQQVVSQTNSYKWTEAVRGVVDTQIGRCHNRESFKNQQNLKKAMHEAKRLFQHYLSLYHSFHKNFLFSMVLADWSRKVHPSVLDPNHPLSSMIQPEKHCSPFWKISVKKRALYRLPLYHHLQHSKHPLLADIHPRWHHCRDNWLKCYPIKNQIHPIDRHPPVWARPDVVCAA